VAPSRRRQRDDRRTTIIGVRLPVDEAVVFQGGARRRVDASGVRGELFGGDDDV
jgi:hypothetical protein